MINDKENQFADDGNMITKECKMIVQDILNGLVGEQCLVMSFPMVESAMTAVIDARINKKGLIKLTYSDGQTEYGEANEKILNANDDDQSLLEWCSCVQAQRSCGCPECKITPHASDCAIHNAPALEIGPCNCK